MKSKPAHSLTVEDFAAHPVWQFINDEEKGEMKAKAIARTPVRSAAGKLIAAEFKLSNGHRIRGFGGNISCTSAVWNRHFLTLSVFLHHQTFNLARYFDEEFQANGPNFLADRLGLAVEDVFPIEYDFTSFCAGPTEVLKGHYLAEPKRRLNMTELAMLAIPILPEYQVKLEQKKEEDVELEEQ